MKTAVFFLLVALSCCFDMPAANRVHGKKPAPSPVSPDCIIRLLKSSLPNTLERLQKMLCCFAEAKKAHNAELYRNFLMELHQALKDAGCTLDELLQLQGALEQVGDQLGEVCEKVVMQILTAVEDLGLTKTVFSALCNLAGDLLIKLSDALKQLDLKIVTDLTGQIGIGGKGKLLGLV